MKTKIKLMIALMFISVTSVMAEDLKTEKFKVYGNCGMCEKRIEKAATSLDGVTKADWDKETKIITVTYNSEKVKISDIHKTIASVGHDTEVETAKDDVYDNLPGCCQYDRKRNK